MYDFLLLSASIPLALNLLCNSTSTLPLRSKSVSCMDVFSFSSEHPKPEGLAYLAELILPGIVIFLHSRFYSVLFWICTGNSINDTGMF